MALLHSKTKPSASAVPLPPTHNALVVRSLLAVTPEERRKVLEDVEYNVFAFPAGLVCCDYLSDSGTSAMTDIQWAASEFDCIPFHLCNGASPPSQPLYFPKKTIALDCIPATYSTTWRDSRKTRRSLLRPAEPSLSLTSSII